MMRFNTSCHTRTTGVSVTLAYLSTLPSFLFITLPSVFGFHTWKSLFALVLTYLFSLPLRLRIFHQAS